MTTERYEDRRLSLKDGTRTIRRYYFPWGGPKHIPLASIRAVHRPPLTAFAGRGRIWGSTTLRYWANLDLRRTGKDVGYGIDLGHHVRPFVTPDDPESFEAALEAGLPNTRVERRSRPPYGV